MWSNIPATYVPASHWCLASFLAALLCGGDRRRIPIYCHFLDQKNEPCRGEAAHFGNTGTCWQGQEQIFWKPCLLMGWEGKGWYWDISEIEQKDAGV